MSIIARSVQSNAADNEQYIIFVSHQTAGWSRMPREIFRRIMADCVKQFRGSLPLKGIGPFTHLDESMSSWDPLIFPLNGLNLCNGKVLFISLERNWVTSCVNSFIEIFMKGFLAAYLIGVTCCLLYRGSVIVPLYYLYVCVYICSYKNWKLLNIVEI